MSPNLHATRIMLADDHAVVRLGFRLLLEGVGATVVAEAFRGKLPLARHRMVYTCLQAFFDSGLHALAIEA